MKQRLHLAGILIAAAALSGCGTVVRSLPLTDSATATAPGGVKLYFGAQAHPALERQIGRRTESARLARGTAVEQAVCDQALDTALGSLRAYAARHGGNAVINITTGFHSTRSDSETEYTCGVSGSAGAISVAGDVVVLGTH
ncbi:signal peptidase [Burkholderia sp. Ac-20379]|uniref:signal peptidase n=1 Tax=Burkholderia sp. Ac-20379 TaxID=2703900 RepID=UPI00197E44A7|nr:signal peptidase [Burkholderia sp. Ac-20379]MBN3727051.1 signal peptidase [Burkholderia sp. Ac-20379]